MFNPEQPRDNRGRWTDTGRGSEFIDRHRTEILVGATLVSAALLTRGKFTAGLPAAIDDIGEAAGKKVIRSATVRKVGPLNTKPLSTLMPNNAKKIVPNSVEGWMYHRGFFGNIGDDELVPVGRRFADLRMGAELKYTKGSTIVGAPPPQGYANMNFNTSPGYTMTGRAIGMGAPLVVAGASYIQGRD